MQKHIFAAVCLTALVAAPMASASGSGSYPSGSTRPAQTIDPYQQAYDLGRRVMRKDITCKTCPYPAGVKDRATAEAVLEKTVTGEITLTREKQTALAVYLDRRFDLGIVN